MVIGSHGKEMGCGGNGDGMGWDEMGWDGDGMGAVRFVGGSADPRANRCRSAFGSPSW